jgi:hypothetical protein
VNSGKTFVRSVVFVMFVCLVASCGPATAPPPPAADTPTLEPTLTPMPAATSAATATPQENPGGIPAIGDAAPDFTLPSADADAVTLSSYRGQRNVVLVFYRTGG